MARVNLTDDDDELTTVIVDDRTKSLSDLQPNPENPRPTDAEVDAKVASLAEHGQLHNINIMSRSAFAAQKPHLVKDLTDEPFVVVNGNERLAAARKAGLSGLRYEIHDEWTANQIDEAVILENEDRTPLNALRLGRYLKQMVPRYGSERALAKALNRQPAWVNHRIKLTELRPELQDAIAAGRISFTVARECPRLHPELQGRLANGELPEDVAAAWLIRERIKPEDQLARWNGYGSAASASEGKPGTVPLKTDQDDTAHDSPPGTSADSEKPKSSSPPARVKPALVIRVSSREPGDVAAALRAHLSPEEITDLVRDLTTAD